MIVIKRFCDGELLNVSNATTIHEDMSNSNNIIINQGTTMYLVRDLSMQKFEVLCSANLYAPLFIIRADWYITE